MGTKRKKKKTAPKVSSSHSSKSVLNTIVYVVIKGCTEESATQPTKTDQTNGVQSIFTPSLGSASGHGKSIQIN